MTKKSRKPLSDTLAQQFVYGGESEAAKSAREPNVHTDEITLPTEPEQEIDAKTPEPTVEAAKPVTSNKAKNKESSLMDKLQVEAKESTTRLTVDLPDSMHRKLSILAAKTRRTKVEIIRMLLDEALSDIED